MTVTQEFLHDTFRYNNGRLYWRKNLAIKNLAGKRAGSHDGRGYWSVAINRKRYSEHRLIWQYVFGDNLPKQIDHINGDRLDNRIENLRGVTQSQNNKNAQLQTNNTSGFNGVGWNTQRQKWCAKIKVNYKTIYLGCYDNIDEAISARLFANSFYNFHENHGRKSNE